MFQNIDPQEQTAANLRFVFALQIQKKCKIALPQYFQDEAVVSSVTQLLGSGREGGGEYS